MKKFFKQKTCAVEQDTAVSARPLHSHRQMWQASFNTSHRPAFSAAAVWSTPQGGSGARSPSAWNSFLALAFDGFCLQVLVHMP